MDIFDQLGIDVNEIKDSLVERAACKIASGVGKDIRKTLIQQAEAIVNAKVEEIVEEVMTQTFQPVSHWGEPKGKPTTIREMFAKYSIDWWAQKVDSKGKISSYGNSTERSEFYARKAVEDIINYKMKKEMADYVKAGKQKIREAMGKAVANEIKRIW